MKIVRFLAVALLLAAFSPATTFAGTTSDPSNLIIRTKKADTEVVYLQLANLEQETAFITITDLNGKTYLSTAVRKHNGYSMNIDMADLSAGRYVMTIKHSGNEYKQVIYKKNNDISLSQVNG